MDKILQPDSVREALLRQAELEEEEREKKLRREKLEKDNFIQSQIVHEAQQKRQQEQEEAADEDEREDAEKKEAEEDHEAEEEARQMEEADQTIDLLGFGDGQVDEATCRRMVDDLLSGRKSNFVPRKVARAAVRKEPAAKEEESSVASVREIPVDDRGIMIGNALRNFCRFIASEVPLSAKHVEAARLCTNILKRAAQQNITPAQMGLSQEEWIAVQGSIQLGNIVKRGLEAKEVLSDPEREMAPDRELHLRNYLTMKALEQALMPHVQKFGEDVAKGQAPLSSVQILLGSPGFSARDMWSMVNRTDAMRKFRTMDRQKVEELVSRENREMDDLGRQAMTACYDGSLNREKNRPQANRDEQPQIQPQAAK